MADTNANPSVDPAGSQGAAPSLAPDTNAQGNGFYQPVNGSEASNMPGAAIKNLQAADASQQAPQPVQPTSTSPNPVANLTGQPVAPAMSNSTPPSMANTGSMEAASQPAPISTPTPTPPVNTPSNKKSPLTASSKPKGPKQAMAPTGKPPWMPMAIVGVVLVVAIVGGFMAMNVYQGMQSDKMVNDAMMMPSSGTTTSTSQSGDENTLVVPEEIESGPVPAGEETALGVETQSPAGKASELKQQFTDLTFTYTDAQIFNLSIESHGIEGVFFKKFDAELNQTFVYGGLYEYPVLSAELPVVWLYNTSTGEYQNGGPCDVVQEEQLVNVYCVSIFEGDMSDDMYAVTISSESEENLEVAQPEAQMITIDFSKGQE